MAIRKQNSRDSSIEESFGRQVKLLRKKRGWTQAELAFRMDIETSNLKKYENARQGITLKMLEKMASAFEISLTELFDFK